MLRKTKKIQKLHRQIQKKISTNPKIITNKSNKYKQQIQKNQQILLLPLHAQMQKFLSQKKNKFRKSNKFCPLNQKKSLSSSSSHCSYHSNKHKGKRGEGGVLVYHCGEFNLWKFSRRQEIKKIQKTLSTNPKNILKIWKFPRTNLKIFKDKSENFPGQIWKVPQIWIKFHQ